ncbi:MAG: YbhB/YbcL family Raf kinase inhibitor-like protein [Actinocatenispora sp.]
MTDRPRAPEPYQFLPPVPSLTVTSTDITDGAVLPDDHVLAKGNVSPQLSWSGAPSGTRGYAVTCFDPDAPTGSGFWHWSAFDIPADVTELARAAGSDDFAGLPAGAKQGRNDFDEQGFGGAAPPAGHGPHRYIFAVHALDVPTLGPDPGDPPAYIGFNLYAHVLARGTITATYEVAG